MKISIIIPTWQEEKTISNTIEHLQQCANQKIHEIIIVDGGSTDDTLKLAQSFNVKTCVSPHRGRAQQMNHGASIAEGDVLYFVHSDTKPPSSFTEDIRETLINGHLAGTYRFAFDSSRPLLRLNSWFTKFPFLWVRGGDQTLFIKKDLFNQLGGFNEEMRIMEDYDMLKRLSKKSGYKLIQKDVVVSPRKYDTNSWLRVQMANFVVFNMYTFGASQERMIKSYSRMLNYRQSYV